MLLYESARVVTLNYCHLATVKRGEGHLPERELLRQRVRKADDIIDILWGKSLPNLKDSTWRTVDAKQAAASAPHTVVRPAVVPALVAGP